MGVCMARPSNRETEIKIFEDDDDDDKAVDYFNQLPGDCIANIISFTSPRDACRSSLISRAFRSAAESNAVWERFLPPDCYSIISRSPYPPPCPSKKDLYFSLCDSPLLIDDGKKSFSLEKSSGKKCYMISARDLLIIWGDTPMYWRWISLPEARFPEVAELIDVCWFEIRGKIDVRILSPLTTYAAYLVFKFTKSAHGFEQLPVETTFGLVGGERSKRNVYLDAKRYRRNDNGTCPKKRKDGWLEVELGDFYYGGDGQDGELEMRVLEIWRCHWKRGFICEGIEIRPRGVIN